MQAQTIPAPSPYKGLQIIFPEAYQNPGEDQDWTLGNINRSVVYNGTIPTLLITFALMTQDGLDGATATYRFDVNTQSIILNSGDTGKIQCRQRVGCEYLSSQLLDILQIRIK